MSTARKVFIGIISALIVITLAFIWGNSLVSKSASNEEAGAVYGTLQPILNDIFGNGVITQDVLRKIAHGAEFFLLGLELNLLYVIAGGYCFKSWFFIIAEGIIVALLDETIQIFTAERGPEVLDVWIDAGGVAAISVICGLIGLIVFAATKNKRAKKQNA